MIKKISHVAVVVSDIDAALEFWRDALGLKLSYAEDLPEQDAEVAFLQLGDSEIELFRPTVDDNGAARFLAENKSGMHHIALEVDDLDAMIERLQSEGVHLINHESVAAARGRRAVFVHPSSASSGLGELYEAAGK